MQLATKRQGTQTTTARAQVNLPDEMLLLIFEDCEGAPARAARKHTMEICLPSCTHHTFYRATKYPSQKGWGVL